MPSEPVVGYTGTAAPALKVKVTCPSCGGVLTFDNGVRHTTDGVGLLAIAILSCPTHGSFEVRLQLLRSLPPRKRPSGAQQRRTKAARDAVAAGE